MKYLINSLKYIYFNKNYKIPKKLINEKSGPNPGRSGFCASVVPSITSVNKIYNPISAVK